VFDGSTLVAFLVSVVAIVVVPGPAQVLVLSRVASEGRRAGVVTTLGLNTGTLVHTVAAALGVSAVLATSATAFTVVKVVGAAYLVFLGVRTWRAGDTSATLTVRPPVSGWRLFTSGLITGVLNPKVALFFLAFLPQFVHPERGWVITQFLVLGLLVAVVGVCFDCVLSWTAHAAAGRFTGAARFARWRQRISGTVLVGLGLRLALVERM
jgi:threonine/homoserine/homoserine lactone efflux protein